MKHVILYVPGLGDKKRWLIWLQRVVLQTWRRHGVRCEIIPMRWAEDVPLRPRFEKLLSRIDQLHAADNTVSLVGTSAGASAVVSAFQAKQKQVNGVVTICGKLKGDIPEAIKELNPCFAESLELLAVSERKLSQQNKRKIMTLRSPLDAIVPPDQAVLDGARNRVVKAFGHNPACAYVLLFQSRQIVQFLKNIG